MFPAIIFIFLIFVLFFYNNRNLEKPIEKVLEEDKDNREDFLCKNFIDNNQKYTTIDFFNNLKLEVKGKPCAFSDLQPIEKSLFKINLYEKIEKELHELLVEESIKNENKEILKNFYFKIKKSIYQEIDLIYDNYSGSISKIDKMFLESKK
jgi:hypothetical protein